MKVKQSQRTCVECGMRIPMERLRMLPDTLTCVRHSEEESVTSAVVYLDGSDHEDEVESAEGTMWNR